MEKIIYDDKIKILYDKIFDKDPIYDFLRKNDTKKFNFGLHYDFLIPIWEGITNLCYMKKNELIDKYLEEKETFSSILGEYNILKELMVDIQKLTFILNPKAEIVKQDHQRKNGEIKVYSLIRSYWINNFGEKKRMVARTFDGKLENKQYELAHIFLKLGFGITINDINVNNLTDQEFMDIYMFSILYDKYNEEYDNEFNEILKGNFV